jgi:hypothetical protein
MSNRTYEESREMPPNALATKGVFVSFSFPLPANPIRHTRYGSYRWWRRKDLCTDDQHATFIKCCLDTVTKLRQFEIPNVG